MSKPLSKELRAEILRALDIAEKWDEAMLAHIFQQPKRSLAIVYDIQANILTTKYLRELLKDADAIGVVAYQKLKFAMLSGIGTVSAFNLEQSEDYKILIKADDQIRALFDSD